MPFDFDDLPLKALLGPIARAEDALARLDDRVAHSPVGKGFVARAHFLDAAAALWLEGELVHVEDLVLHDARMDIRTPTHEITRAHAVLRTRRAIAARKPNWALSPAGLVALRGRETDVASDTASLALETKSASFPQADDLDDAPAVDDTASDGHENAIFADIDAVLARARDVVDRRGAVDRAVSAAPEDEALLIRDPIVFDAGWDEASRLAEWSAVVARTKSEKLPAALAAALAWEAWESIEPLQNQAWLGNLLVAALLRERGKVGSHLFCMNAGLRAVARDRRRHRDRATRLTAFLESASESAQNGLKEIERLGVAKARLERKLADRRSSSSLPALVELTLSRPMLSSGMIVKELNVTTTAAHQLVAELGLREMTGRGRFRAWGVI